MGAIYALARGRIVIEADTNEPGLSGRLEHAYLGSEAE
jgi:hypothetical protein